MSTLMMAQCWPLKMPPTPKAILISLADNANDQGYCWPSIATVCVRTCFSKRAVIDAIAWLESTGALEADRTNGRHTTYVVTPSKYVEPVQQVHRCGKSTGAPPASEPVQQPHQPVHLLHQPVQQPHTNRQEPSLTVSKSNRQRKRAPAADIVVELPPWLDPPLWESWVRDRRERGHPLTQGAADLSLASLARLRAEGWPPKVVIENAIELGWRGLYAPKNVPQGGTHATRPSGSSGGVGDDVQRAIDQRNARAADEQRGVVIEAAHAPGAAR